MRLPAARGLVPEEHLFAPLLVKGIRAETRHHLFQLSVLHLHPAFPVEDLVPLHRSPAPLQPQPVEALAPLFRRAVIRRPDQHRHIVAHQFDLLDEVPSLHPEGEFVNLPGSDRAAHGDLAGVEIDRDPVPGDRQSAAGAQGFGNGRAGVVRRQDAGQAQAVPAGVPVVVVGTGHEPEALAPGQTALGSEARRPGTTAVSLHGMEPHIPLGAAVLRKDFDHRRELLVEKFPVHPAIVRDVVRHQDGLLFPEVGLQGLQIRSGVQRLVVLEVDRVDVPPGIGVPLVPQEAGELPRLVVGGGGPLDPLPVFPDHGVPLRGPAVGVDRVRGEGVEIQVRAGDLITALQGALGIAQFVVIVEFPPVELVIRHVLSAPFHPDTFSGKTTNIIETAQWPRSSSALTSTPSFSITYGFLRYAPAPNLCASSTRSVSEKPLTMTARCPGCRARMRR